MNYQDIVDLIRIAANAVNPTGHFVHGRNTDGSLDYDYSFPQIHLLPVETTYDIPNDIKTHTVILMFWEQDSPESTNLEREQKIAAMDVMSDNFLSLIYNNAPIQIEDVLKTPEYRQLAGTASGYGLSFSIVSKVGCLPIPFEPCQDVIISINGIFYSSVPSGGEPNILVQYENGDPVGTIVGNVVQIPDSGVERRNDWQAPYSYCGTAPTGTLDSAPDWIIYRIEVFQDGTVNVMSATNVAWTDRYIVIYT